MAEDVIWEAGNRLLSHDGKVYVEDALNRIDELCNALRHALAVNEELRRRLKSPNQHLDRVDHLEDEALKTLRLYRPDQPLRDKCEVCNGWRGGVPGNENIVKLGRKARKIMCDDCSAEH